MHDVYAKKIQFQYIQSSKEHEGSRLAKSTAKKALLHKRKFKTAYLHKYALKISSSMNKLSALSRIH